MRLEFARLRAESGLTFDALSSATGLSRMAVINMEHGKTRGSLDSWFRVAEVLDVSLVDLVAHLYDPPAKTKPRDTA